MKKSEALKILELQNGASEDEIKKAHRRLIIANHPDKFGQDEKKRAEAEEKTKLINEARDVLLTGKWDPEYSTSGTPYGAPFTYSPTGTRTQGGQNQYNPFGDWPFPEGSFVWTTWDSAGQPKTYTSNNPNNPNGTGQNPYAYNPFSGFNPFTVREKTDEEKLAESKKDLTNDIIMLLVKIAILGSSALFGVTSIGLYLYVIISIGQGIMKHYRVLAGLFMVPFIMLVLIFLPRGNSTVGIIGIIALLFAIWFDINNIYQHAKTYTTLKKKTAKTES